MSPIPGYVPPIFFNTSPVPMFGPDREELANCFLPNRSGSSAEGASIGHFTGMLNAAGSGGRLQENNFFREIGERRIMSLAFTGCSLTLENVAGPMFDNV